MHKFPSVTPPPLRAPLMLDSAPPLFLPLSFASPSSPTACIQGRSEAGKQESPAGKERELHVPKKPEDLLDKPESPSCCSLHHTFAPRGLHSLWTGLFSAAGRPPCTCWRPLCTLSAWLTNCPACGGSAPSAASRPFPSSTTLFGRTTGLPPERRKGESAKAQRIVNDSTTWDAREWTGCRE